MRKILFTPVAFEQYNDWLIENKQIHSRLKKVNNRNCLNTVVGTGKPVGLKYDFAGCWSRRISDEHRLMYGVLNDYIEIIACKYHY